MIVAITGIGSSDIISATVGGATYGTALLWAIVLGVFFKFVLNEGIARWQIGTGTSIIHGWAAHLPRWVIFLFTTYLVIWIVGVSAALTSGCGLAIENISHGTISSFWGGVIHALMGGLLILSGHFKKFEKTMKVLTAIMFVSVISCVWISPPQAQQLFEGLFLPAIPLGANTYVLSLIGGIGGSLTMLSYNYLDPQPKESRPLKEARRELIQAYIFITIFGMSVMVVASDVFFKNSIKIDDRQAVKMMAQQLQNLVGNAGFYLYSIGFWAAVVASLLGVWKTVPLMTADCFRHLFKNHKTDTELENEPAYRITLTLLSLAPIPILWFGKPLVIIILFTILGSLFVPFLAFTLLYLHFRVKNQKNWIKNSTFQNISLYIILILFLWIGFQEASSLFIK